MQGVIFGPTSCKAAPYPVTTCPPASRRIWTCCSFPPSRILAPDEEIELEESELDEIPYEGDRFDLGEAVAQSLALAIDPFACGPDADRVRQEVGLAEPEKENPFAKLKGLGLS